jgi:addiction module HigA family antidote
MKSMHDPSHPGEVLREYLPAGLALSDVAKRLGVTRQALSALVNGRAGISASMALRLEAALGTSAEMWLGMQTNYDLWQARKRAPKVRSVAVGTNGNSASLGSEQQRKPGVPPMFARLREAIAALCERHGVRELSLFGSVLREDFRPDSSDVDAVALFGPPKGESLARQYFDFKRDFEELLARPVDLVEIEAMPDTRLRRIIERTKVPIYAAAG